MAIDDKTKYGKRQYDINSKAEKISPLSSWKIDKYEYLADEEVLSPNEKRVAEPVKLIYSLLKKRFELNE